MEVQLPPGGWTQNRNSCKRGQVAPPVNVTDAPVGCGDARSVVRVAALQAFNTYVMLATPS